MMTYYWKFLSGAKIAEATYTVLIEQVKSQTLVAGFQPEKFKVFEYARPPLYPSSPVRRNVILKGIALGLVLSISLALLNSLRRGVYYSSSALTAETASKLAIKSKSLRRLARQPISKLMSTLDGHVNSEVDEIDIKLADKNLIYILDSGGLLASPNTAMLLAAKSSSSGKKVVLYDATGQSEKELSGLTTKQISGLQFAKFNDDLCIMKGINKTTFFTSSEFNSVIKVLLDNFDQVFFCTNNKDAILGLMALEKFDPSVVLLAGLQKSRKVDVKKIKENQPIDIMLI